MRTCGARWPRATSHRKSKRLLPGLSARACLKGRVGDRHKILQDGIAHLEFTKHPPLTGIIVMREKTQQPNWVAVVFQNAAVGLQVARQTTLAQLAEQLSALAEVHGKLMLPVQVHIATAPSSIPGKPVRPLAR